MTQDLNRHRTVLSSQPTATLAWETGQKNPSGPTNPSSFSVESSVDRLMDDLFADVECSLNMQDLKVTEVLATVPRQVKLPMDHAPTVQPENDSPPPLTAESDSATPLAIQVQANSLPQATTTELDDDINALAMPPNEVPQSRSYDRLLLATSCISLLLALGAWLLNQELRQPKVFSAVEQNQSAPSSESISSGFSEYMQRSIDAIERRTQPQTVATAPTHQLNQGAGMPIITVPKTPPLGTVQPAPAQQPSSPTRVYVPNYPIPLSFLPNRAAFNPAPLVKSPNVTLSKPVTKQQPMQPPAPLVVPSLTRTLRGVVEIGPRSAALIETDGIVQSFRLGESIGSSGWTLVEVSKDRIIIRRNGEVRSISVEQRF
jgi:hypothetical protein